MFVVTDPNSRILVKKDKLEDAILFAWAHTNHRDAITDDQMAYFVDFFNRLDYVIFEYGFYSVLVSKEMA